MTWGTTADTVFIISNVSFTETVATTIAQHTETIAAHDETARGTIINAAHYIISESDSILISDSLLVGAQTFTRTDTIGVAAQVNTVAAQTITSTVTKTQPGVNYDYIRVTMTGTKVDANIELQAIEIRLDKVYY